MAAAASSRLSCLFLSPQPHSGRHLPRCSNFPDSTLNTKARRRPPNPYPNIRSDATLNSEAAADTNSTSKAPRKTRRLSQTAFSILNGVDLDLVVTAFKERSSRSRFRRNPRIFELVVRRLAAAGRQDGVAEILEAQKAYPRDFSNQGFASRIISLYGKACMPDHAYSTYRELPSLGCPPSIFCLNALICALVRAGEPARAFEVFREECTGLVPNDATYNALAYAAIKMGDLDTATGYMRKIQEEGMGPPASTFNTILNELCRVGRFDEAEKVWESMEELGISPNVMTCNARLRSLVAGQKLEQAADFLDKMGHMGIQPDAFSYSPLISAYGRNGDLEKAKKLFEEMLNKGCSPNQVVYMVLVPRMCEAGEIDRALELCRASLQHKCCVTKEALVQVTDALVASGRLADAKELLAEARSKNYYRNSLDVLEMAEERANIQHGCS